MVDAFTKLKSCKEYLAKTEEIRDSNMTNAIRKIVKSAGIEKQKIAFNKLRSNENCVQENQAKTLQAANILCNKLVNKLVTENLYQALNQLKIYCIKDKNIEA